MAVKDVKNYYFKMLNQYLEVKADLEDFEQALKAGYITEDKLADAIDDVSKIKSNLDRLSYILFLLDVPKRKRKKAKYKQDNKELLDYFEIVSADENSIVTENTDVLEHLRNELKKLKTEE